MIITSLYLLKLNNFPSSCAFPSLSVSSFLPSSASVSMHKYLLGARHCSELLGCRCEKLHFFLSWGRKDTIAMQCVTHTVTGRRPGARGSISWVGAPGRMPNPVLAAGQVK